ncbi:MAG: flagellar basal body-associated FliL family protein [Hasllibacter sp.]
MKLLLILLPVGVGAAAGWAAAVLTDAGPTPEGAPPPEPIEEEAPVARRLENQFVIPLFEAGTLGGHAVLSIALSVRGDAGSVHDAEPRLRDAFLTALADHSQAGGFSGHAMDPENLDILRGRLLGAGRRVLGDALDEVLIGGLTITRAD